MSHLTKVHPVTFHSVSPDCSILARGSFERAKQSETSFSPPQLSKAEIFGTSPALQPRNTKLYGVNQHHAPAVLSRLSTPAYYWVFPLFDTVGKHVWLLLLSSARRRNQRESPSSNEKQEKEDDTSLATRVLNPRRNDPCGSCSLSQRESVYEDARYFRGRYIRISPLPMCSPRMDAMLPLFQEQGWLTQRQSAPGETGEATRPHLITHVATTAATTTDEAMTETIHADQGIDGSTVSQ